ncbi:hypothetical protein ILUMI_19749 [Ignelater luminosus]|uniref:Transposase n=1 Tax=Ignelater luminosus TaxID=2038154 RepID=A0A8K0G572_IGNLU|nr:hypothetical protein ILUMI_19749 [Ignelater luminosus]
MELSLKRLVLPYGISLLKYLKERNYDGTETIQENCVLKYCPLTRKKVVAKKERGTYESALDRHSRVLVVDWVDNAVVAVASKHVGNVKRYSQAAKFL